MFRLELELYDNFTSLQNIPPEQNGESLSETNEWSEHRYGGGKVGGGICRGG